MMALPRARLEVLAETSETGLRVRQPGERRDDRPHLRDQVLLGPPPVGAKEAVGAIMGYREFRDG